MRNAIGKPDCQLDWFRSRKTTRNWRPTIESLYSTPQPRQNGAIPFKPTAAANCCGWVWRAWETRVFSSGFPAKRPALKRKSIERRRAAVHVIACARVKPRAVRRNTPWRKWAEKMKNILRKKTPDYYIHSSIRDISWAIRRQQQYNNIIHSTSVCSCLPLNMMADAAPITPKNGPYTGCSASKELIFLSQSRGR